MTRLLVLVALTALAVAVAMLLQRRRPEPPSAPSYRAPTQVDRADFAANASSLLLVMFSSTACSSCADAWRVVQNVVRPGVEAERVDLEDDPDRHRRYQIDGVPTTLVVNVDGVVQKSFFGPMSPEDLAAAMPPTV